MKKLFIYLLLFYSTFCSFGENKVAGIEIRQTFNNISGIFLHQHSQITWTMWVIQLPFGKIKIPIPTNILLSVPLYYSCMEYDNKSWVVSVFGRGFKKCDYTNVYADGSLPSQVMFYLKYLSLGIDLKGLHINNSPAAIKEITTITGLKEDTMLFLEAEYNFSSERSNEQNTKTTFSSFGKKYPNCSFVNDTSTDVVVKVIPPNNPHYDEYCEFLKGISTRSDNSVIMTNWDEYATEISLKAGENLTMPDRNNVFHIEVDMSGDDDEDGLSNEDEIFKYGTDPENGDTDDDGLEDGVEVIEQTIVLHLTEGDKTNVVSTIANWHDTDDDGISDGDEVLGRHPYVCDSETHYYVTDPTSPDTDEDGLTDDIDPHPLDPCNSSNAIAINSDWMNYWTDIAQRAGISFLNLNDPFADSDGDGIDNLTEMKNKTNPIFTNGFRKIIFEPAEIHFSLGGGEFYTNSFYLSVFSSDTMTGAVYVGSIDWKPLLDMEGLSVFWEECPLDRNSVKMKTFSAKYFNRFKFTFLLNYSDMNFAVREQEIKAVDCYGEFDETLNLVWDTESGDTINEAPSKPILLEPVNGDDVVLQFPEITEGNRDYEQINFVWLPSVDPEGETVTNHFYLYDSSFDLIFDDVIDGTNKYISTEDVHFERGYHYWQVVATDPHGNTRASDSGVFFISSPGDTDNDGVDDDYEIKRGSDPFDPNDYPLTIASPENLDDGFVGREYFCRLTADGGKGKKYIWRASDESTLPPGVHLDPNGEIRGKPTEDGNYIFKVSVFDGKDVFSKSLRITVLPKREGLILRLGKGLIKQR